jgi:hypothetical protein
MMLDVDLSWVIHLSQGNQSFDLLELGHSSILI